jgi:hypothetical protein
MQIVSVIAWDFGEHGSCDVQCIGFTGNHKDKQQINHLKRAMVAFADSFLDEGCTYSFFFRNQQAPAYYLNKWLFTHSLFCVLFLFDTLPYNKHVIGLGNLFTQPLNTDIRIITFYSNLLEFKPFG